MSIIGDTKEKIILHLSSGKDYGYSIADELELPLPAVYEHLDDLKQQGLAKREEEGEKVYYILTENGQKLSDILRDIEA